jgi:hypothetical protein
LRFAAGAAIVVCAAWLVKTQLRNSQCFEA